MEGRDSLVCPVSRNSDRRNSPKIFSGYGESLLIGSRDGNELDSNSRTLRLARFFFFLIGSSAHTILIPQRDVPMFFSLAGHTNAALALKVNLLF